MSLETDVHEILMRSRRIETRITGMAIAQGLDVTSGKSRVHLISQQLHVVDVSGMDVSFGDVLAFCRRSGINQYVTVMCRDVSLGTLNLPEVV